ncbi:hypothetical protein [Bdellovibrio sp. HCB337]|uniref:hypothetical protein n=1 Tax=Bdellovibrio sp. HCB337 TaxID=3394358 RepID=UPI0039A523CD
MAAFQCSLDIPKVSGLEDNQLTVGREFYLACKGDWPKTLKLENLKFVGDENFKYQLKLLGFEFRSPEEADLKVTSYLPAQYQIPQLVLTDGEQTLDLGQVQFEVVSILPPQQPQQQQGVHIEGQEQPKVEPYGPFGPATIPVPALYWLALLGSIGFMAIMIALKIWRYNQRREMLLRLKEHDSALSPLLEFHQSMRRLQRSNPVFYGKEGTLAELREGTKELSRMFKVYISRRLKVPAFEWNERLIVKDIRKYHPPVYESYSKRIHDLFGEFRKAEGADQKLAGKDISQLAETLRKTLEGIENLMIQAETAQKGER